MKFTIFILAAIMIFFLGVMVETYDQSLAFFSLVIVTFCPLAIWGELKAYKDWKRGVK